MKLLVTGQTAHKYVHRLLANILISAEEEDQIGGMCAGSVATLLARDPVALFAGRMKARKVSSSGVR
jgi:hypothetical protein